MQFNIKALRQAKADLTKEAGAILDAASKEGWTDDKKQAYEETKKKIQNNNELLAECEEQMERERELELAHTLRREAEGRVQVTSEGFEADPKGGFKDHKDYLNAVMQVGYRGKEDARLVRFRAEQGSDEQQAGQDPYGGYLIPVGIAPGVLSVTPEDDPVAALVRTVPMNAPTVAFNARVDKDHSSSVSGGLTVARTPETVDATSSRMKFEQIRLTAHDLFGFTFATENILSDSPESFIALLVAGFGQEFGGKIMHERLNGTGAGEFLGVLNSGCACTIAVSKESGQTADTIVKENIDKIISRCWNYGRAVWHANHNTIPQLRGLYQLVGTTGGAPVAYLTGSQGGQQYLVDRPIYFTEHCATLGDRGDIALCMWGEYLQGTYQRMRRDESMHVRFLAAERCFRFFLRNDGKPWWTSALTPKNGSTLSPFVTLAART